MNIGLISTTIDLINFENSIYSMVLMRIKKRVVKRDEALK